MHAVNTLGQVQIVLQVQIVMHYYNIRFVGAVWCIQGAAGAVAHYWQEESSAKYTKQCWGGTERSMRFSTTGMSEHDETEQHLLVHHDASNDVNATQHTPQEHSVCTDSGWTTAVPQTDEIIDWCEDGSWIMNVADPDSIREADDTRMPATMSGNTAAQRTTGHESGTKCTKAQQLEALQELSSSALGRCSDERT
jgi:hypothetical protein